MFFSRRIRSNRKIAYSRTQFTGVDRDLANLRVLSNDIELLKTGGSSGGTPPDPIDPIFEFKSDGLPLLSKDLFNTQSSTLANGCGPESNPVLTNLLPDQPFKTACDQHDICFGTGQGFQYCNNEFLIDMQNIADNIMENLDNYLGLDGAILMEVGAGILLNSLANAYYEGVSSVIGANTYCGIPTNSSSSECNSGNNGGIIFVPPLDEGIYQRDQIISQRNNAGVFTYYSVCELWKFPDGNGGHYIMPRNCRITYANP